MSRIVCQNSGLEERRIYAVNLALNQGKAEMIHGEWEEDLMNTLTADGREIVLTILGFEGVENVFAEKYQIQVTIGKSFDWQAIHKGILGTLSHFFQDEVQVVDAFAAKPPTGEGSIIVGASFRTET